MKKEIYAMFDESGIFGLVDKINDLQSKQDDLIDEVCEKIADLYGDEGSAIADEIVRDVMERIGQFPPIERCEEW